MKLTEKSQELLERYLLAVERKLPFQGRKELVKEIRANLMDNLDDHYQAEDVITEEQMESELRKLGSPQSVASGYYASDVLIAPQHNFILRLVSLVVAPIVVGVLILVGLVSFFISGGKSPFWSIGELLGNAWQVGVGIIGTAAIILMILTRFFPKVNERNPFEVIEEKRGWKVSDLPELVAKDEKIQLWEPIIGIIFGSIGLFFWLFLFDDLAGLWWLVDDQWHMVPIFTDAFKAFIPWIAVNTGLGILLDSVLLYQAKRGMPARLIEIGIKISEISLVSSMLKAGQLLSFDSAIAAANGFPAEGIAGFQKLFQYNFVEWFLIFLVVVLSIDLLKKLVELLKHILVK